MIALGLPEVGGWAQGCGHVVPPLAQDFHELLGVCFLGVVDVQDRRKVLVADVGALSVLLGRVVNLEEAFGEGSIGDLGGS